MNEECRSAYRKDQLSAIKFIALNIADFKASRVGLDSFVLRNSTVNIFLYKKGFFFLIEEPLMGLDFTEIMGSGGPLSNLWKVLEQVHD